MRYFIIVLIYKLDLEAAHKFYMTWTTLILLRRLGGHNVICITILVFQYHFQINS